jgi:hypothetical protein
MLSIGCIRTSSNTKFVGVVSESITKDGGFCQDSSSVHEVNSEVLFSLDGHFVTVEDVVIKNVSHLGGGGNSGSFTSSSVIERVVTFDLFVIRKEVPFGEAVHNVGARVFTKNTTATGSRGGHEGVVLGRIGRGEGWVNAHVTVPFNGQIYRFSISVLSFGESLDVESHSDLGCGSRVENVSSFNIGNYPTSSPARSSRSCDHTLVVSSGWGCTTSISNKVWDKLHGSQWAQSWTVCRVPGGHSGVGVGWPVSWDGETMVTTV